MSETSDSGTRRADLAVWLSVRGSARAVAFYQAAFGAIETYHLDGPNGDVISRLAIGGSEFWVSEESPGTGSFSPQALGGSTTRMILTVADPDAVFARALAHGAVELFPVAEEHGWRIGRVIDPFGHHWEIGREL